MNKVIIYTDGGCRGNQETNNIGGWGAVITYNNEITEIKGGIKNTTNNIMELTACIKVLEKINPCLPVELYTDSAYVCNGINSWVRGWKRKGWKTANKKPVKNKDLWIELDNLVNQFNNIQILKVKGHVGVELNERADELANIAMDELENECENQEVIVDDTQLIQLDREKSHELFNKWRDLSIRFVEMISTRFVGMNSIVQNPDFACKNDIDIFNNDCKQFEDEYKRLKKEIRSLFK